jgi:ArsR family transcriptional regulator, arsenate/arsenite/antimonite-responsive transcriptional repressor
MKPRINSMFRAFADETRLRILHLLTRGELCVCDVVDILKLPQPKVSRHLAYLKSAGLVEDRKEGLWRHYSLTRPESRFQKGLVACLRGCFDEVDVLKQDVANLEKRRKAAAC